MNVAICLFTAAAPSGASTTDEPRKLKCTALAVSQISIIGGRFTKGISGIVSTAPRLLKYYNAPTRFGSRVPKPGLPKKYAKMGFKKGWRAFKAAKRKRTRRSTSTRRRTSAGNRRRTPARSKGRTMRRRKSFNIPLVKNCGRSRPVQSRQG